MEQAKKEARFCKYVMTKGKLMGLQCNHRILTDNEYCAEHRRVLKKRADTIHRIRTEAINNLTQAM